MKLLNCSSRDMKVLSSVDCQPDRWIILTLSSANLKEQFFLEVKHHLSYSSYSLSGVGTQFLLCVTHFRYEARETQTTQNTHWRTEEVQWAPWSYTAYHLGSYKRDSALALQTDTYSSIQNTSDMFRQRAILALPYSAGVWLTSQWHRAQTDWAMLHQSIRRGCLWMWSNRNGS